MQPNWRTANPNLTQMLLRNDGALIIGDQDGLFTEGYLFGSRDPLRQNTV